MYKQLYIGLVTVVLLILMPFMTIWSINTLFLTNIHINADTWVCAAYLTLIFGKFK